jgi:putative holliday junction resolvase
LPGRARDEYHSSVRVLALDVGRRRVGVAISDASAVLARPLEVVQVSGNDRVERVAAMIARTAGEDDGLDAVVVGWPTRLDGSPNEQTAAVAEFVEELKRRIPQPVALQDERLSSVEAESRLAVRDRDWRSRKKKLDAAAAAVILQDYLDAHPEIRNPDFSRCSDAF